MLPPKRVFSLLFITAYLNISFPSVAKSFKVNGKLSLGATSSWKEFGAIDYEADIKVKSKRKSGIRSVTKFRGSSETHQVELREAYFDLKKEKKYRILAGYTKKIMGLEYQRGSKARILETRTFFYENLQKFSYVGKEALLRFEPATQTRSIHWSASIGYNESQDVNSMFSISHNFGGGLTWYQWLLLQSDSIDSSRQFVWCSVSSLEISTDQDQWQWEVSLGQDPFESEYRKTFGDGGKSYFLGSKWQYANNQHDHNGDQFGPLIQTTAMFHRLDQFNDNSLQFLIGGYYQLGTMTLSAHGEIIGNYNFIKKNRTYHQSKAQISARQYF